MSRLEVAASRNSPRMPCRAVTPGPSTVLNPIASPRGERAAQSMRNSDSPATLPGRHAGEAEDRHRCSRVIATHMTALVLQEPFFAPVDRDALGSLFEQYLQARQRIEHIGGFMDSEWG